MEDRILENHVIKWMKSVEVIDANLDRLEESEKQAYHSVVDTFGKNRPNMEVVINNAETLKQYLDGGVKDNVYTAVRDFLKTTEIARSNFQAFKELLEDRGFFNRNAAPAGSTSSSAGGVNTGTAVYRRTESEGIVYEGMFIGDERVWKGKINYPDGAVYEGEWDNSGPHGEGVLTKSNGNRFAGRFEGLAGTGRVDYANDNWYEGPWDGNGDPHGRGVWRQGNRTDRGEYSHGSRIGNGRMEWDDGDWYEGGWNDTGANGYGTYRIGNRTDKGQYENSSRIGNGRMEWDNGDWYEGGWNDKGKNGYGTSRIGNRTDKGQYENGVRIGKGRMEWDNGDWYEGGWNDNGKHGKGTQYILSMHRTDIGEWDNNNATGSVIMKWDSGDSYTGTWSYDSNGNINGTGVYYTAPTQKKSRGKWVTGKWIEDQTNKKTAKILWIIAALCILSGVGFFLGVILFIIGLIIRKK